MQLLYFGSISERTEANAPQTGHLFVIFLSKCMVEDVQCMNTCSGVFLSV